MKFQFVHVADIHLGNQQYGSEARFNDFGRAFLEIVAYAVDHNVNFVLLAGDLFHKHTIDPLTLLQAVTGLDRLRDAGIPVIAIEGNHDRASYRDVQSWLHYLAAQQFLVLLRPSFDEGEVRLDAWNGETGAFIDVAGARIYGVNYLGAALPRVIESVGKQLTEAERAPYTILQLHAGLEGEVPNASGTLTEDQLAPLHPYVDYLALGHLHKQFERDGWIFNPGSPEVCGIDEIEWPHGLYHVQVDTESSPIHRATHILTNRRLFRRLRFAVDGVSTPAALYDRLRTFLQSQSGESQADGGRPVVELTLHGVLAFTRGELDAGYVEGVVRELLDPLVVRVRNETTSHAYEVPIEASLGRPELERHVLRELLDRDARYRPAADIWADAIVDTKRLVVAGAPPSEIVDRLRVARRTAAEVGESA